MRILKIGSCSSRSGLSTLTYHVGCDDRDALHVRVHLNSGNGVFNGNWVSLHAIESILISAGEGFTSFVLTPLYQNQSTNSPAFLLAALLQERLVMPSVSKKRGHQIGDFASFRAAMQRLIDDKTNLDAEAKPPKLTKKRKALDDEAVIDQLVQS